MIPPKDIGSAVAEGFTKSARKRSQHRVPGPPPKFRPLPEAMKERLRLGDDQETIYWAKGRIPGKPVYAQTRHRAGLAHRALEFDHVVYAYHRVVWFLATGEQPLFIIDHIDRDGTNNCITNLRRATTSLNQANRKGVDGRSLPKGVYEKKPGRFCAQIGVNGHRRSLGNFDTPEEAHEAYMTAARAAFGEFARGTW